MQLFLQTCSTDLNQSRKYFSALDFTIVERDTYSLFYDQNLNIRLEHSRAARRGITLIKENWESELAKLQDLVHIVSKDNSHYFIGASGTRFQLISSAKIDIPETSAQCILGNYAGLSLETFDIHKSLEILACFGFSISAGGLDQGWVSCTNKHKHTIGLMSAFSCPHSFANPSAAFFNGKKNVEIIANVRQRNLSIYEEVTVFNPEGKVDNIIMREPGGLGFFVFSD